MNLLTIAFFVAGLILLTVIFPKIFFALDKYFPEPKDEDDEQKD